MSEVKLFVLVAFLFFLAMLLPGIAAAVRRLHDTGRSGSWYFVSFIPMVGGLILLILTLLDGQYGDNDYGPDPRRNWA